MADITSLFKATVKAVKLREQNLQQINSHSSNLKDAKNQKSGDSLGTHTPYKSEFSSQATAVVANIRKLQEFLLKYRKDYINASGQLSWEPCSLTDAERDQIDHDAEVFIKTCADAVRQLKGQANSNKVLRQVKEHKEAVLSIIDKYLIAVCHLYSEQKAVRVKRVVDHKRLARLEKESLSSRGRKEILNVNETTAVKSSAESKKELENETKSAAIKPRVQLSAFDIEDENEHEPMSAEEEKMLQMENEQMFEEMSGMVDEVRQIEGKLVEISRLQEIFAEKVLQQESDIDKVADLVIGSTENIKDGNEEIREAMKNNASFRIWILFFLIMCSLSLLFLDWYNA